ncbi:MAG: hypothetical protein NTY53_15315 [Kiritimatiellaeota bacterium]|nr:hypothetical protein [Kiritimatiellota bacterium]
MKHFGIMAVLVLAAHVGARAELTNSSYRLALAPDHAVRISVAGLPEQRLAPDFVVLHSAKDPGYSRNSSQPNYPVWSHNHETLEPVNAWLRASRVEGKVSADAHDNWTWTYPSIKAITSARARQTSRPFMVGENTALHATSATEADGVIRWQFAPQPDFEFAAELRLPPGASDPVLTFTLTPRRAACWSVAFTGAPATDFSTTHAVPQDCETRQECETRGHHQFNYVMSEADLKLPRALVATTAGNIALVADPVESPFRLPTGVDARFGLMLQQTEGKLQPVLFAPLLGGAQSQRDAGAAYRFTLRCVVRAGDWKETTRHIARDICGVRDQRDNSGPGSLNAAIERVMAFLGDRDGHNHACWHAEQKYFDYFTDTAGVFKPFSPLYGLGAAVVTEDEDFFRRRARPAVEFALSRKGNVFSPYETANMHMVGAARSAVGGPYIGQAQLLGLHEILQRRVPVVAELAKQATPAHAGSVTSEAGLFDSLEQFDATHDPQALERAVEAAYHQVALLNLSPAPPASNVLVDAGGRAPVHPHSFGRHRNQWGYAPPEPVAAPEQNVPAWRVARIGLPSPAYPMEYWMNVHGALLRTAALAHDDFLRDVAHWGMTGRFGNYPGDNRSIVSLIGERPDAVETPPWEWNFATVNPGHAWDFVGALLDFLVSDAFDRSGGAIDFPAESAAGSNFRVRVYGARPGRFCGDDGVRLWLPRALVTCDNRQFDWLASYGNGQFYLALWSQSFREETVQMQINPALVELGGACSVRIWRGNAAAEPMTIRDGKISVSVPAKGLIAFAFPDARVHTKLQALLYDKTAPALGAQSFVTMTAPFGTVRAMLLTAGRGLTSAFVYADASAANTIAAKLRWRQGAGAWHELTDEIFPYEFSPELDETAGDFECVFEIENAKQEIQPSAPIVLKLGAAGGAR